MVAALQAILSHGIVACLVVAALHDLTIRLVPNSLSILIALAGLAIRASDGLPAIAASAGAAALLFFGLVLLHSRGLLGGGDVKLCAAVACGLPPLEVFDFLIATTVAGTVLGCLYLALSQVPVSARLALPGAASLPRRVLAVEWRRIRRRGPLPYAVAIACGGALVHLLPNAG
jgi:prepilin peptidase CpaA